MGIGIGCSILLKMKKILLLVPNVQTRPGHMNWISLRDLLRIKTKADVVYEMSALDHLCFVLDGDEAFIYDRGQSYELSDFDLIVFRTIGKLDELAISIAAYCRKKYIPYIDTYISTTGRAKLGCAFVRWEHDLPVPATLYGPAQDVAALIKERHWQWPLVVKDDNGKKGRNNYLIHDEAALRDVLANNPDVHFVVQQFVPNNGDYRIVVMGGKARLAILRTGSGETHLNNTSQGGSAQLVDLKTLNPHMIAIAERAALVEKLEVAGVDMIQDKATGTVAILEANRAPQLGTGAFVDEKIQAYVDLLTELVEK
jgi:glutathione synthase/RimK-type ligase-like ATP-grasp enzyme